MNRRKRLNRIISEKFNASLMSDSKWEKFIDRITDFIDADIFIYYKLIHDHKIYETFLKHSDFKPFFAEPTIYKEVEWIEFPDEFEDFVSKSNLKAGKRIYRQDVQRITDAINKVGQFVLERNSKSVRLYAYR